MKGYFILMKGVRIPYYYETVSGHLLFIRLHQLALKATYEKSISNCSEYAWSVVAK